MTSITEQLIGLAASASAARPAADAVQFRKEWAATCAAAARSGVLNAASRDDGLRGRTAAHMLCAHGSEIQLFDDALEAGLEFTQKDKDGAPPALVLAARPAEIGNTDGVIRWLSERTGADLSASGPGGWTPLHAAALHADTKRIRTLGQLGADIEAALEENRWTPLHVAAHHSVPDVLRCLLRAGADASAQAADGRTPGDLASANRRVNVDNDVTAQLWARRYQDVRMPRWRG